MPLVPSDLLLRRSETMSQRRLVPLERERRSHAYVVSCGDRATRGPDCPSSGARLSSSVSTTDHSFEKDIAGIYTSSRRDARPDRLALDVRFAAAVDSGDATAGLGAGRQEIDQPCCHTPRACAARSVVAGAGGKGSASIARRAGPRSVPKACCPSRSASRTSARPSLRHSPSTKRSLSGMWLLLVLGALRIIAQTSGWLNMCPGACSVYDDPDI